MRAGLRRGAPATCFTSPRPRSVIPVAGDTAEWKLQSGERSFKVLGEGDQREGGGRGVRALRGSFRSPAGFQPASSMSRYAFLGAVDLIVPKPPAAAGDAGSRYSDSASTAVSALARALAEGAMVGVARLVYQKNAAP